MAQYWFRFELTDATTNIELGDPSTSYPDSMLSLNKFDIGDTVYITLTAKEGYYFPTPPTLFEMDTEWEFEFESDDEGEHKSNYHLNYQYSNQNQSRDLAEWASPVITALAQVTPKDDKYGIISIYNPTPAELRDISEVRYNIDQNSSVDLGNYISSLIKVFVKLPKGDRANVLIGGYNTNVTANVILDDIVETDCGTINIVGKYGNAMDYENTTVEIYLPFIGFKPLETVKVMNETLSLFYKTNVINGDTIACIYNTTGTLLYTFNCKASFEIPYRLNNDPEPQGKLDIDSNYLFGFTPFVTIRYNKAYNAATTTANDDRETTLDNLQGYVKCSEVFNTIRATTAEKEEIDRLLKEGVIIT